MIISTHQCFVELLTESLIHTFTITKSWAHNISIVLQMIIKLELLTANQSLSGVLGLILDPSVFENIIHTPWVFHAVHNFKL